MADSMDLVTVMIVDDHEMVRRGACSYLEAQTDISVVAQAGSGERPLAARSTCRAIQAPTGPW